MPKIKPMHSKALIEILEKLGFKTIRQKGSHLIMRKDGYIVVVPVHEKPLKPGLIHAILREVKVPRSEFMHMVGEV